MAATRSYGSHSGHMVAIQNLEGKISSHAMDILKAQQSQTMAYTIADGVTLPNGSKTYVVHRVASPFFDQSLSKEVEHTQEDYGLNNASNSVSRARHVTTHACTCQFPSCWGLPCRHMLRLYLQLQLPEMPEGVVKQRWCTHSIEYIAQEKRKLLRTMPIDNVFSQSQAKMTRFDRYRYLLHESKSICEIAALSEASMDVLVKHLDMAKLEISKLQLDDSYETSMDPSLFPSDVLNPGLPQAIGRPATKRKENHGKFERSKSSTRKRLL